MFLSVRRNVSTGSVLHPRSVRVKPVSAATPVRYTQTLPTRKGKPQKTSFFSGMNTKRGGGEALFQLF